jgi:anti-anti-sigma factor
VNELFGVEAQRRDDGVGVVRLSGEVDMYTAPQLKQSMLGLIDEGAAKVVIDLSGVTFIDSTALGVLIGGVRRLRAAGGPRAVHHGPGPRVHHPRHARGRRRRARLTRRIVISTLGFRRWY